MKDDATSICWARAGSSGCRRGVPASVMDMSFGNRPWRRIVTRRAASANAACGADREWAA